MYHHSNDHSNCALLLSCENSGGPGGGGGGVGILRFGSDGGVPLKPPNPYPSLRVILAERVPIIRGFYSRK